MATRHVLVIVENLPVPLDRRVWSIANSLRHNGYDVSVICPRTERFPAAYERIDGIDVHRHTLPPEGRGRGGFIREYAAALYGELRLARQIWKRRPFDAVHICNPPDLLFLVAGWYRLRHGVRVMFDHHDLVPGMYQAKYGSRGPVWSVLRALERMSYRTAHRAIVTNRTGFEVAIQRGGKASSEVDIVTSGPDPARYVRTGETERSTNGAAVVGYVGIMGDQDGVDHLVNAIDHLVHHLGRSDIRFRLIGDGPARADLQLDVKRRNLGDVVEFTGTLLGDDLIAALSATDLCVDPEPVNGYSEYCTTNKVLEYMALERPVVQFDRIEGRRAAGDAALNVEANNASALAEGIVAVLDDPERRATMSRMGRRRIEDELGWHRQEERLLAAYAQLFGS